MIIRILSMVGVLVLLAVLATPMTVLAEDTHVNGDIGSTYTLSVPSDFGLGTLNSAGGTNSGSKILTATTNDLLKTSVKIDVLGTNGGKLTKLSTSLSSSLSLSGTGLTTTSLTGTNQTLIAAGTLSGSPEATWSVADLVITQPAFTTPVPAGNYTCTITFTATFNP